MAAFHTPPVLAAVAHDLLRSLNDPRLGPFLAGWPAESDITREVSNRVDVPKAADANAAPDAAPTLPVLRWLPLIARRAHGFAAPLVQALFAAAPALVWRQTYSRAELGDVFLRGYAYTEIVGPRAPVCSERIACGFLLLGPSVHYPRHRHEAEEIYVSLSGSSRWLQGDAVWRNRFPGTVIHHASEEPHAVRTTAEPLLAVYLWRSTNLNQRARLDADESATKRANP